MNVNKTPPKAGTRLSRIQSASRILRVLVAIGLIVGVPTDLAHYLGWLPLSVGHKILISPHQLYASSSEIPRGILALTMTRLGLSVLASLILYICFASTNVEFCFRPGMFVTSGFWVII